MKLFVFDIDNTLLSHHQDEPYIPNSAKEAIINIKEQGHDIMIATGRNYSEAKSIMSELSISKAALCDGAVLVNNDQIIHTENIPREFTDYILDYIIENDVNAIGFHAVDLYMNKKSNNYNKFNSMLTNELKWNVESSLQFSKDANYSMISIFNHPNFIEKFDLRLTKYSDSSFAISPKVVSKAFGIKKLLELTNNTISMDKIFVFGDGVNDIEMFSEFYNNSYVLGNAHENVKKYAKNICEHIENDGLAKAVDNILKKSL